MSDERERIRRLTQRVSSAGRASKLGPADRARVLSGLPGNDDPHVLVDHSTGDDAGAQRRDSGETLVQTVDVRPT